MPETVALACERCGDAVRLAVAAWAQAPERAYCDAACHRAATAPA